jgi:hypothetical protein
MKGMGAHISLGEALSSGQPQQYQFPNQITVSVLDVTERVANATSNKGTYFDYRLAYAVQRRTMYPTKVGTITKYRF